MNKISLLPLLTAAALAAPVSAQNIDIVQDTFEYATGPLGGQSGGQGWTGTWWSGQTQDGAVIEVPGLDGVGGMLTTNIEHEGSYRLIDMGPLGPISENLLLGKDGTTVWFRFTFRRTTGGDDSYGGIVLNQQFVGEQLFIGSPFGGTELGIERPFVTAPTWIPGTDCDLENTMVTRIDFLPGDDRVRVWANPGVPFPTTTPDIDQLMPDIKFNEIKFSSGEGLVTGFHFDNFVISTPEFGPKYTVLNLTAGQQATLQVTGATPNNLVILAYSVAGPGPTNTQFGAVAMTPPIQQLAPIPANANGVVTTNVFVPATAVGITVYTQGVELLGGGGGYLTNALAEVVQ
jgi:hypothetical protein